MIGKRTILIAAAALASAPASLAADQDYAEAYRRETEGGAVWMDVGLGYMNAKSNELVYDEVTGRRISKLIWNMDQAAIAQVNAGVKLLPGMALKLRGTFGIDGDTGMTDYDWAEETAPDTWTHRSIHDDTDLDHYNRLDANVQWDFVETDPARFGALAGLRFTDIQWTARGGDFVYTNTSLRDTVGSFDDGQRGITYQQNFLTPYVGFAAGFDHGDLALNATVIASVVAKGDGEDQHWLRGLEFRDDLDLSTMFSIQGEAVYRFNRLYQIFANVEYERYADTKGTTDIFDLAGNMIGFTGDDSSGADHRSLTAVAGVRFSY
jgi:outer membrane protease